MMMNRALSVVGSGSSSFTVISSSSITTILTILIIIVIIIIQLVGAAALPTFELGDATYAKIDFPDNTTGPRQISYDPTDDLFIIAVTGSNKIYTFNEYSNTYTHIAGTGTVGYADALDGTDALFNQPTGITVNFNKDRIPRGYLISDTGNNCLRRMRPDLNNRVYTMCGICDGSGSTVGSSPGECSGAVPKFNAPGGLDHHWGERIWAIADQGSHTVSILMFPFDGSNIRHKDLLAGTVDIPGSADGPATSATFNHPFSVALFPRAGSSPLALFISEHGAARLRRLIDVNATTGVVSTLFDHGTSNKGWGLSHQLTGAFLSGQLLWWNDFNGMYHFDLTDPFDVDLSPSSLLHTVIGFRCGERNIVWPEAFQTNLSIFATRNSQTTAATDYDIVILGADCPTTTTTTIAPAPTTVALTPPVPGETYINDVVAMRPDCGMSSSSASSTLPPRCTSQYSTSSSCVCPPQTASINITLVDVGAVDSSANTLSPVSASTSEACGAGEIVIGLCSTASSVDSSSTMSAFITTDDESSNCLQANPETGDCSCPENRTLAFPLSMPALVSNTSGTDFFEPRTRTTFCMPLGQAVYWSDDENSNRAEDSSPSSSCLHPLGENYTCECGSSLLTKRIPAVVYNNTQLLNTGALTFCGEVSTAVPTTPLQPSTVSPAISALTVAVTSLGAAVGSNIAILQGAALMLSISCDDDTAVQAQGSASSSNEKSGSSTSSASSSSSRSSSSRSSMVTFQTIESAGEAEGWAFMFILAVSIPGLHALVVTILALIHWFKSTPIKDYEAAGDKDRNEATSDQNSLSALDIMRASADDSSRFAAQWQGAAIQLKFPHFSLYLTNLVFAGLASESAILVVKVGTPAYLALGVFGLVLCVCYIVFVGYLCHYRKQQQLEDDAEAQQQMEKEADRRQKSLFDLRKAQSDSLQTGSSDLDDKISAEMQKICIDDTTNDDNSKGTVGGCTDDDTTTNNTDNNSNRIKSGSSLLNPTALARENGCFFDNSSSSTNQSDAVDPTKFFAGLDTIRTACSSDEYHHESDDIVVADDEYHQGDGKHQQQQQITTAAKSDDKMLCSADLMMMMHRPSSSSASNRQIVPNHNRHHQNQNQNLVSFTPITVTPHSTVQDTIGCEYGDSSSALAKAMIMTNNQNNNRNNNNNSDSMVSLGFGASAKERSINGMISADAWVKGARKKQQQSIQSPVGGQIFSSTFDLSTDQHLHRPPSAAVNNHSRTDENESQQHRHHQNQTLNTLRSTDDSYDNHGLGGIGSPSSPNMATKPEDRRQRSISLLLNVDSGAFDEPMMMMIAPSLMKNENQNQNNGNNFNITQQLTSKHNNNNKVKIHSKKSNTKIVNDVYFQPHRVLSSTSHSDSDDYDNCGDESILDQRQTEQEGEALTIRNHDATCCQYEEAVTSCSGMYKLANDDNETTRQNLPALLRDRTDASDNTTRDKTTSTKEEEEEVTNSLNNNNNTNSDDTEHHNHRQFWPPPLFARLSADETRCLCDCGSEPHHQCTDQEEEEVKNADDRAISPVRMMLLLFTPKGLWFADDRNFNRRFGALFFLYTPTGAAWAPVVTLFFLLVVAVVSSLNGGCEVSLHTLGALHAVLALLFLWKQPTNVSFDNALLVLQYFAGSALAFSRGAKYSESLVFFTCILIIAIVSVVHAVFQYLLEEKVLMPKKRLVFRSVSGYVQDENNGKE